MLQVEQFEILLQMQGKFQKLGTANFECFEVYFGVFSGFSAVFVEVIAQESCYAEMVQTK